MNKHSINSCPIRKSDFGIETELLLTCSRKNAKSEDFQRQQQIANCGFDEALFLKLVNKHKVAPLVHMNLRKHPAGTFNPDLLRQLEDRYKQNAQSALQAHALIHKIVADNPGIPISIFKGIESSLRIFGDLAARDVGDIDLLCSHPSAKKLLSYFEETGWEFLNSNQRYVLDYTVLIKNIKDVQLLKKGFPRVELHWRLTRNDKEFRDPEYLSPSVISKVHPFLRTLTDEEVFVYLCVHGFRHGWERLKWLFDFPEFIESREINWPKVLLIAEKNGAMLPIQQTLLLCKSFFDINFPSEMEFVKKNEIREYYWKFSSDLISGKNTSNSHLSIKEILFTLFIKFNSSKKFSIKISHLLTFILPTEREVELILLPKRIQILYIPLRLLNSLFRKIFASHH